MEEIKWPLWPIGAIFTTVPTENLFMIEYESEGFKLSAFVKNNRISKNTAYVLFDKIISAKGPLYRF